MASVDHLRDVLHHVAGLLVWPVLAALLGLVATTLVWLGAFAREALARRRGQRVPLDLDRLRLAAALEQRSEDAGDLRLEAALHDAERRRWRGVARVRMAVRLGPALGLMGTLIPMANALQGLADGNLPALASNMVTAFAATVIGLAVSVVAFLIAAVREEWVRSDLEQLAFHAERLSRRQAAAPVGTRAPREGAAA